MLLISHLIISIEWIPYPPKDFNETYVSIVVMTLAVRPSLRLT